MKKVPPVPTKTFNEVPTVNVDAFLEARKYMDDVLNGRVDPEELKALLAEGVERKNRGMGFNLRMTAEGRIVQPVANVSKPMIGSKES